MVSDNDTTYLGIESKTLPCLLGGSSKWWPLGILNCQPDEGFLFHLKEIVYVCLLFFNFFVIQCDSTVESTVKETYSDYNPLVKIMLFPMLDLWLYPDNCFVSNSWWCSVDTKIYHRWWEFNLLKKQFLHTTKQVVILPLLITVTHTHVYCFLSY